jgi:hypothetical protein
MTQTIDYQGYQTLNAKLMNQAKKFMVCFRGRYRRVGKIFLIWGIPCKTQKNSNLKNHKTSSRYQRSHSTKLRLIQKYARNEDIYMYMSSFLEYIYICVSSFLEIIKIPHSLYRFTFLQRFFLASGVMKYNCWPNLARS